MALATSNAFNCPNPQIALRNRNLNRSLSISSPSFVRFSRRFPENRRLTCAAASAAGSSSPDGDLNPYEVLGVSSIEGFDKIKTIYAKKRKDAERIGDEATAARLEKAYDKLMMDQLTSRKKGISYGSFKVSKDIKYADKQPIVPWGPRFTKSSVQDMRINLAIACAFEEGEDDGRTVRMGKRILRSLALVFGSIAFASLAFTGVLNLIELSGSYIPVVLYNNQELFVTSLSAFILYILGSYYR